MLLRNKNRLYCRDLLKLRLKTAEVYVKVLTGDSSENAAQRCNHQLSLAVAVLGLGPTFTLQVKVRAAARSAAAAA